MWPGEGNGEEEDRAFCLRAASGRVGISAVFVEFVEFVEEARRKCSAPRTTSVEDYRYIDK